jgi:nicotinamidase-related amidase
MTIDAPARTDAPSRITPLEPVPLDPATLGFPPSNVAAIPPLAEQWRGLDLREILARPAAFLSVSQSNSLYRPGGVQYAEGHAFRGSLEATVRVVEAARRAPNFVSFNWIGYSVFRHSYPQTDFDRAQYAAWTGRLDVTPEQIAWDDALVDDLRDLVRPGDNELYEKALQTAFIGTDLPLELARKKVEVLVIAGIHLDWCIEGNARAARDNGYLPIVVGDATGTQHPSQEPEAFRRINEFFAPVISSEQFAELVAR